VASTSAAASEPLSLIDAAQMKLSASCLRAWGDELFWIEGRPDLGGCRVVVRWKPGREPELVSPGALSVSSRVHEYGGGAMCVLDSDGPLVVGVRAVDQRLVSFRPGDDEVVVREELAWDAIGDLSAVPGHLAVTSVIERQEPSLRRSIVMVDLEDGGCHELIGGRDFLTDPRISPAGDRLVWCAWDHPLMPWEGAELWTATLDWDGSEPRLGKEERIAGGAGRAAGTPSFADDGSLLFTLEADGWIGICRWTAADGVIELISTDAEFRAPHWELGEAELVGVNGRVLGIERRSGFCSLVEIIDGRSRPLDERPVQLSSVVACGSGVAWMGAGSTRLGMVGRSPLIEAESAELVELGPTPTIPDSSIAVARPIFGAGRHGGAVHGLLYAPSAPLFAPPPVIVFCHGGPTAQARVGFDPIIQVFTSRGFAVLAVNYAGSTGFGTTYRRRLDGTWGVSDVQDCVDLLEQLGEQGLVDASRAAIRGGSAGGLTALLALTTGSFRGAVSWYGVADLLALAASTHDFEAHYLDSLVGRLPAERQRYAERSPVNRAAEMRGAVLLLQGLDDPVVPVEQARAMAAALEAAGQEVTLVEFAGESHGFRRLETLVAALEAELAFYEGILLDVAPAAS